MDNFTRIIIFCLVVNGFNSCNSSKDKEISGSEMELHSDSSIRFAERFLISKAKDFKVIYLLAKPNSKDTTDVFILYDSVKPNVSFKNSHFIKTPCNHIAALSSIYANMITEVGCLNNLSAIENVDYYNNPAILKAVQNGSIKQVQKNPEIDRELILKLRPDIIFAFGMNRSSNDFDKKIVEAGIPVVICLDHLERTPLARAEWIKFYAAFVNRSDEATRIFDEVEKDYHSLKELAKTYQDKPNVLTELKFGDTWYVPGGKSFMAQLINDANANYFWNQDTATGSLPLSFEAVYKKARTADYWLNVSLCTTREQVLSQDKRYADFDAYKKDGIYNNNLNCNKLSYSTYWETGMIYPNRILSDMIQIFHKDAKDSLVRPFYYYQKLN